MSDLYSRQVNYGGSFSADRAVMTIASFGVGQLITQLSSQYTQQLTKLYDLTENSFYLLGGRTNGNMTLGRVLGPSKIQAAFYKTYGDLCKAGGNTLAFKLKSGLCSDEGASSRYTTSYNVITSVGMSVNSNDMIVSENMSLMFSTLDYE